MPQLCNGRVFGLKGINTSNVARLLRSSSNLIDHIEGFELDLRRHNEWALNRQERIRFALL